MATLNDIPQHVIDALAALTEEQVAAWLARIRGLTAAEEEANVLLDGAYADVVADASNPLVRAQVAAVVRHMFLSGQKALSADTAVALRARQQQRIQDTELVLQDLQKAIDDLTVPNPPADAAQSKLSKEGEMRSAKTQRDEDIAADETLAQTAEASVAELVGRIHAVVLGEIEGNV